MQRKESDHDSPDDSKINDSQITIYWKSIKFADQFDFAIH